MKGTLKQNIEYCSKSETKQGEPTERGTRPKTNGGDRKSAKFHYHDLQLNLIQNPTFMADLNPSI